MLPTLYIVDAKGVKREWKIWREGSTLIHSYGIVKKKNGEPGQKIVHKRDFKGVNIGDVDEKTPEEHAQDVMASDWASQLDKGYKPDPKDKEGMEKYEQVINVKRKHGGHNINVTSKLNNTKRLKIKPTEKQPLFTSLEKNVFPMKAHEWDESKYEKYFDFEKGVYIQPKYDGWRCLATFNEKVTLTTGTSKQYPWFAHIRDELAKVFQERDIEGLDGELYAESITDEEGVEVSMEGKFSMIQSICALTHKKPHPLETQIKFYVFDLFDTTGKTQTERFETLDSLFSEYEFENVVQAPTRIIHSLEEIADFHSQCVNDKFEGVILRDSELVYKQKSRAQKMRKYKEFQDKEFSIIGIQVDEGVDEEQFVWLCKDEETGVEFKAKPEGNAEEKREWFQNSDDYIGKIVTIKYQGVSKDGVPRFPIAKAFRDLQDN